MENCSQYKTQLLVGKNGIDRLKNASVAVIGLGGVGSYAAEAVARCWVGHMVIVDPDRIEGSNLNRQLHALTSTVGCYKTEVMGERLLDINPLLRLEKFTCAYNDENSAEILSW
ncbi:MAG: ThiF family adenylyltransferase, partial [Syntrophomonadaceae bacterium]|nr:ThiF family adenylyltransferase [Syntrophomonadaceae bacterium]